MRVKLSSFHCHNNDSVPNGDGGREGTEVLDAWRGSSLTATEPPEAASSASMITPLLPRRSSRMVRSPWDACGCATCLLSGWATIVKKPRRDALAHHRYKASARPLAARPYAADEVLGYEILGSPAVALAECGIVPNTWNPRIWLKFFQWGASGDEKVHHLSQMITGHYRWREPHS